MSAVNAVGAIRNMAANNMACQDGVREAGGIASLLDLLRSGPDTQVRSLPSRKFSWLFMTYWTSP